MEVTTQPTINEKDFRLGNWFFSNIYQQVELSHLEYLLNDAFAPHSAIKPIPLTPELLEKCGFEKSYLIYNKWYRNGETFYLYVDKNEIIQAIPDDSPVANIADIYFNTYNYIGKPLLYLHELQNRFYSFTGEELEVKYLILT